MCMCMFACMCVCVCVCVCVSTVQCLASPVTVNCSRPDAESLFVALETVLDRTALRPVHSLSTPTNISIKLTVHGILGVVSEEELMLTYRIRVIHGAIKVKCSPPFNQKHSVLTQSDPLYTAVGIACMHVNGSMNEGLGSLKGRMAAFYLGTDFVACIHLS